MSVNLRKRVNLEKSGLGKYAGVHGVIHKSEIAPGKPSKGIVGKGVGKGMNFPMDSEQEFEKRVKRYQRECEKATAIQAAAKDETVTPTSMLAVIPA